jgi:hypothetical protein
MLRRSRLRSDKLWTHISIVVALVGASARLTRAERPTSLKSDLDGVTSAPLSESEIAGGVCRAQLDREYEERARREFARAGVTEERLRQRAIQALRSQGVGIFQLQRVFISGIWSHSGDDTDARWGKYYSARIALSFSEDDAQPNDEFWRHPRDSGKDVRTWRQDYGGDLSDRAKQQLRAISDTSINEILAHSWATDAIYAAVLAGIIVPPRRVVLLGMPGRNLAKWEALSRASGTEVVIYGVEQDLVSRAVASPAGKILFNGVSVDPQVLHGAWKEWCARSRPYCHPRGRPGGPPAIVWKVPAGTMRLHYASEYFTYLLDQESVLVPVQQMEDEQQRLIEREIQKLVHAKAMFLRKRYPRRCSGEATAAAPAAPAAEAVHEAASAPAAPAAEAVHEAASAPAAPPPDSAAMAAPAKATAAPAPGNQGASVSPPRPPPRRRCHLECTSHVECEPITTERICTSGECFDVPRQHCPLKTVCPTICN